MTITIPPTISFDSIDRHDRGRSIYTGIDTLADSIAEHGLIQPIVIVPTDDPGRWQLNAGGRRCKALESLGVTTLYYAVAADPDRPGFVVKGVNLTESRNILTEVAENLHREDLDWRDSVRLITKAWRIKEKEAAEKQTRFGQIELGQLLGINQADISIALRVHDELVQNPEKFLHVNHLRNAIGVLLKEQAVAVAKVAAVKSLEASPLRVIGGSSAPPAPEVAGTIASDVTLAPAPPVQTVRLTDAFFNISGLEYLRDMSPESIDHIVTDPDYAVAVDLLESNASDSARGVVQSSVEESLADLYALMPLAFRACRGFFIFWYDLDHHEKLQRAATDAGFAVQRWPLIWHKTGFASNAAPQYNFCKNFEYAMVCRKPGVKLTSVQTSSLFASSAALAARQFNHPFAKPVDLWKWIYSAISIPGQTVLDPFVGSGSAAVGALDFGLRPFGCEVQNQHYNTLILNLQTYFRSKLSGEVKFE